MSIFKREKTLAELEEEREHAEAESSLAEAQLSTAQKRAAIARLRESGLKPAHFGFDWNKIVNWVKTH